MGWTLARQAISGGDDGLARECLTRKQQFATTLRSSPDRSQYEPAVRELENRINELKTQHAEMENRIELLEARSHLAATWGKKRRPLSAGSWRSISGGRF